MAYSWKYYLLAAHLVDENGRTACNRKLPQVDDPVGEVPEKRKCKTCVKFEQRQKEKNEPKYDPLGPFGADSFYSEYCREFSGPGAER